MLPIVKWLSTYDGKRDLFDDFVAGLTVFVFLIPQGMAYSVLGGLPPVYGLYTATIPLFVYAVTGTSRHISLGPMAITSLLLGQMTAPYGYAAGSFEYVQVSLIITFISGILTLLMGVFKLGTLSNFLSPSVLSGFMTGSSCVIALNQLKYFLGLKMPRMTYSHEIMVYILTNFQDVNGHSLWIGLLTMGLLWAAKQYRVWFKKMQKKIDEYSTIGSKLFFRAVYTISLLASLLSLVTGSFIAKALIESKISPTLSVVGVVPAGMKDPTGAFLTSNLLSLQQVVSLLPTCIILTVVGFTGNWAVCTKYSVAFKYEVDASQELVASGLTNLIGPFFNAFFASGGIARSAVNVESGAKTQLSGVITGVSIILALAFCTTWFYYIPMSILAAIIVVSIIPMADFAEMFRTYKTDRRDCIVITGTFLVTFWIGVKEGVTIGLLLSIANVLVVNGYPPIAHLGRVKDPIHGTVRFRNVHRFPEAEQIPATAIVRLDAGSLFFANTAHFKDIVMQASRGTFHSIKDVAIEHVVLDGSSWVDMDLAGRKVLLEIKEELARKNVMCTICNLKSQVRDKLSVGAAAYAPTSTSISISVSTSTNVNVDCASDSRLWLMDVSDALVAFNATKAATPSVRQKRRSFEELSAAEWIASKEGQSFGMQQVLQSSSAVTNPLHISPGGGGNNKEGEEEDEESALAGDSRIQLDPTN